jgi:hypothetical protein
MCPYPLTPSKIQFIIYLPREHSNSQGVKKYMEICFFGWRPGKRGKSVAKTIKTIHFADVSSE